MTFKNICYLCLSENTRYIGINIDFDTNIYTCNNCGLIQNDFVSSAHLEDYYLKKYREDRDEMINDKYIKFMSLRAASQHEFIIENLPKNLYLDTVLDIGAGAGKLLDTFKQDATLFAVEPDAAMAKHMKSKADISLIQQSNLFKKENFLKFNLITLSHVFEHINNPLEYLCQLHKITSINGYVFIEVPNEPECLVSYNIRKNKKGIGHLFDYTVDTLRKMVLKSELFEIVAFATYSVSVSEYLRGASIMNFERNNSSDGVYIRYLLKRALTNNPETQ